MTPPTFYETLSALAPVANHLWQSSVFALGAAILTVFFRKNHARVRYGIWLVASLKFILPISALIAFGQYVSPRHSAIPQSALYSVIEVVGQPFKGSASSGLQLAPRSQRAAIQAALPSTLFTIWSLGCIAAMSLWWTRWRRISSAKNAAVPMPDGSELRALRRLEHIAGVRRPIEFLLSVSPLEPGIFGVFHPVLLWPAGISKELGSAHVEAILAHEVWHVRRRDNLAATLHMLVEVIFWFNPLVWWIGARLIEERERACDEGVLQLGSEPAIYAESILKTCKFCVGSSLPCVSGVNSSNLKQRIVRIMTQESTEKLSLCRRLLITSLSVASVAGPIVFGVIRSPQVNAQPLVTSSDSDTTLRLVSLKRNHSESRETLFRTGPTTFTVTNATIKNIIGNAYHVKDFQLSGGPAWINSERYDIAFTLTRSDQSADSRSLPNPVSSTVLQKKLFDKALQNMLAEQCHLTLKSEKNEIEVYSLKAADSGPKVSEAQIQTPADGKEPTFGTKVMVRNGTGQLAMTGPITGLVNAISLQLDREVIDLTGLRGNYDLMLHWSTAPSVSENLAAAVQEQLGLQLSLQRHEVQTLAVEQVEMPSEK